MEHLQESRQQREAVDRTILDRELQINEGMEQVSVCACVCARARMFAAAPIACSRLQRSACTDLRGGSTNTTHFAQLQLERAVYDYHRLAERLQIVPSSAKHANGMDLELRLAMHEPQPEHMISVHIKGTIKVCIHGLPPLLRVSRSLPAANDVNESESCHLRTHTQH